MPAVPDHELIRRIGGGSYGDVWLARTTLGTWRAVKVVFRDRFLDARPYEREFSGIRKFEPLSRSNEGFIDILQIGRNDAQGYFYYVMELADDAATPPPGYTAAGLNPDSYVPRTLAKVLLQRGRLPVDDCLELGLTLNLGLAHLHKAGLIHRDIKPSNIIYVDGVPKLADIGLVVEFAEARSFVGTEGFIPPEGPNSPQADLYSLGKVLYEAGMGKDRKDFPEPFTQLIEATDATALLEFNAVLLKACAASREERYQSAEAMNADLALLQSGGSVRRQRKLAGQLRFVRRAGALVTALATLIALGWWWQARQTQVVRGLSEEKTRLAEENRTRVVRLDVANGVRLLDAGDPGGALLWFAEALPLVTDNPAVESIHRIRIQQTIRCVPRLHQLLAHEREPTAVAVSEDGRRIAVGDDSGFVQVWDSRSGQPVASLLDSGLGSVGQVRFFRDGRRVFAASLRVSGASERGSATNAAVVWDTETGHKLFVLALANLVQVCVTPDERWLVSAEDSGVLRLHDASDGHQLGSLVGLTNRLLQLEFSRHGNLVAARAEDFPARFQSVGVWRLPAGEPIGRPVRCARGPIALSSDGRFLAVAAPAADGGDDTIVQTWNLESEALLASTARFPGAPRTLGQAGPEGGAFWVLTEHQCVMLDPLVGLARGHPITPPTEVTAVAVSPDGRMVAFGGGQGFAGAWDFDHGDQVLPPLPQAVAITDLEFSPDGDQVLVAQVNGAVLALGSRLLREDEMIRIDAPLGGMNLRLPDPRRFSPGRRQMLLPLDDGAVRLVNFEPLSDQRMPSALAQRSRAEHTCFDASGRRRAVGSGRTVELWTDSEVGSSNFVLRLPQGGVREFRFTPDGALLVIVCDDGYMRLWNTADGSPRREVQIPAGDVVLLCSDARRILARSSDGGPFRVIDLLDGKETPAPSLPPLLTGLVFSPSGERVASVGPGNWSRVWQADTFEPVTPALDHGGPVLWVDWSPDGRHLVTAGLSPEVRVWDAETGEPRQAPLTLGAEPLRTANWSLDGRLIAARGDDRTTRVWDAATGDPVTPLLTHQGPVHLAQLVVGQRLVTLSFPDYLRAWDLRPCPLPAGTIVDLARLFSGRRLTDSGASHRLTAAELRRLFGELHHQNLELFSTSNHELAQGHRREVGLTLGLTELNTALFHLDRLAELAPTDPEVQKLRAQYQARRIPPRAPETPANLVDLSAFYGASLDTTMYGEFSELPRGLQRLAGTLWDLRGTLGVGARDAVNRIPVRQYCRRLQFLQHTGGFFDRDGEEVAHWVIHYADGSTAEWPLIYGEQIRDWWWNYDHPREANQAVIAWEGHPNVLANGVRLFKATWTNPRPDVAIESLDLVGGDVKVTTVVVAITAE